MHFDAKPLTLLRLYGLINQLGLEAEIDPVKALFLAEGKEFRLTVAR